MPKRIIRIFLDTNVWFSAFYRSSNCEKLVYAHQNNKIIAVISALVLDEIIRNVTRKIPYKLPDLKKILLNTPPEIIPNPQSIPKKLYYLASPGDLPIFVSAFNAKVSYFVTGNIKDFSVKKLEKLSGIRIVSPHQAVAILKL